MKEEVSSLINLVKVLEAAPGARACPSSPMSLHLVFTGQPGHRQDHR